MLGSDDSPRMVRSPVVPKAQAAQQSRKHACAKSTPFVEPQRNFSALGAAPARNIVAQHDLRLPPAFILGIWASRSDA
jgi:hypothetical protein